MRPTLDWRDCIVAAVPPPGCDSPYTPATLCELCGNACGFCSWSKKGVQEPVEGWRAVRVDLASPDGSALIESYVVQECPEFALEARCAPYLARWDPDKAARAAERRRANNARLRVEKRRKRR